MPVLQLRRAESQLRSSLPEERVRAAPFLKWVGGKTSLLPELLEHVPARLRRYHEPFLGGGALFFAVAPRRARISDGNAELIHCYLQVRDGVFAVLDALARHVYEKAHFAAVRELDPMLPLSRRARGPLHLPQQDLLQRPLAREPGRPLQRPHRPLQEPALPRPGGADHRQPCAARAWRSSCAPFEEALVKAAPGDFVYLDPPYDPVSATASFASYTPAASAGTTRSASPAAASRSTAAGSVSSSPTPPPPGCASSIADSSSAWSAPRASSTPGPTPAATSTSC